MSDEVGATRSLLVFCCAFRCRNVGDFPNLTVKKIPKAVLNKCEWGHDDYSLEIKNLPAADPRNWEPPKPKPRNGRKSTGSGPSLFDGEDTA